jgi:hypothetical protein
LGSSHGDTPESIFVELLERCSSRRFVPRGWPVACCPSGPIPTGGRLSQNACAQDSRPRTMRCVSFAEFFERRRLPSATGTNDSLTVDRPALRTDTTHVHTVGRRSWTNPEAVDSSSTALADERRLHESALDRRSIDRYRDPDLRARNRARDRDWHCIPWTGCLLVPKAARSQDRSQSQIVPVHDPLPRGSRHGNRLRPRGQRVDDGADDAEHDCEGLQSDDRDLERLRCGAQTLPRWSTSRRRGVDQRSTGGRWRTRTSDRSLVRRVLYL